MPTYSWLDVLSDHVWDNDVVNRNYPNLNVARATVNWLRLHKVAPNGAFFYLINLLK